MHKTSSRNSIWNREYRDWTSREIFDNCKSSNLFFIWDFNFYMYQLLHYVTYQSIDDSQCLATHNACGTTQKPCFIDNLHFQVH